MPTTQKNPQVANVYNFIPFAKHWCFSSSVICACQTPNAMSGITGHCVFKIKVWDYVIAVDHNKCAYL